MKLSLKGKTELFSLFCISIPSPLLQFLPTGIKITVNGGKSYKLSVLKRKSVVEFIESKLK
mgnify:CR=1 FL=1|jgi:hypothetical protein